MEEVLALYIDYIIKEVMNSIVSKVIIGINNKVQITVKETMESHLLDLIFIVVDTLALQPALTR